MMASGVTECRAGLTVGLCDDGVIVCDALY